MGTNNINRKCSISIMGKDGEYVDLSNGKMIDFLNMDYKHIAKHRIKEMEFDCSFELKCDPIVIRRTPDISINIFGQEIIYLPGQTIIEKC